MAVLNPEHLFEQGDLLIAIQAGRPRQVDIRRAISAAYYGLFHAVVTAAADQVVGQANRANPLYGLIYRSIDHKTLREFCKEAQKQTLPDKYKTYAPPSGGFGQDIIDFATAVTELQEKRHTADYDPMVQMSRADAVAWIGAARAALLRFQSAHADERIIFLSLLLFPPRR